MTNFVVEHHSVFDLGPNDEILIELVKVNSALQTPCNQATVPAGLYGLLVFLDIYVSTI